MLLKRLRIALDLSARFISNPITLTIATAPLVVWPLKRLFVDHTSLLHDLSLLLGVYAILGVALFVWKFVQSAQVIAREPVLYAQISELDPQEQSELRRLVRAGKMAVGPPLLDRVATKTSLIYRDVSGEWRLEREHRRFLKDWEKQSRET
jgi:hypothetical protein